MKVTLVIEYYDMEVSAVRIADSIFDIEGVEGVEIKDIGE